jgi:hypothetical protein
VTSFGLFGIPAWRETCRQTYGPMSHPVYTGVLANNVAAEFTAEDLATIDALLSSEEHRAWFRERCRRVVNGHRRLVLRLAVHPRGVGGGVLWLCHGEPRPTDCGPQELLRHGRPRRPRRSERVPRLDMSRS